MLAVSAVSGEKPRIKVIAHRGAHVNHPENTLPAIEAAIQLGCDYVEVDVRTTRDGALVLMHNETVGARTNGSGRVAGLTLAEVKTLDAGGAPVPTFDEALAVCRGRIAVYVDAKSASAAAIAGALRRSQMAGRAVVYGGAGLLAEIAARAPEISVMPEAVSVEVLRMLLTKLRPKVVAFNASDFRDDVIAVARQAGAEIFVDRLGRDDNPDAWQDAIRRGAAGIQTDKPAELLALVR